MRSGAIVEDLGDRRPSQPQRSSSVVENILEISSEVSQAPPPGEEAGVSRRRTVLTAEL